MQYNESTIIDVTALGGGVSRILWRQNQSFCGNMHDDGGKGLSNMIPNCVTSFIDASSVDQKVKLLWTVVQ